MATFVRIHAASRGPDKYGEEIFLNLDHVTEFRVVHATLSADPAHEELHYKLANGRFGVIADPDEVAVVLNLLLSDPIEPGETRERIL